MSATTFVMTAILLLALQPAGEAQERTPIVGAVFSHKAEAGDTLPSLGARYGVAPETLARLNRRDVKARLRAGEPILIDNRHIRPRAEARVVINVAQRLLYLEQGAELHAYPVGVGRQDWRTPLGPFTVIDKEQSPTWDVPASIQEEMRQHGKPVLTAVPPGPDNPLGARFIRLSFANVGIHGTNDPASVYGFVTHGCIRMNPEDILDVYPRIAIGATGVSIYEPVLAASAGGRVYVEFHRDTYGLGRAPMGTAASLIFALGESDRVDWRLVVEALERMDGIAVDVTRAGAPE